MEGSRGTSDTGWAGGYVCPYRSGVVRRLEPVVQNRSQGPRSPGGRSRMLKSWMTMNSHMDSPPLLSVSACEACNGRRHCVEWQHSRTQCVTIRSPLLPPAHLYTKRQWQRPRRVG